MITEDEYMRIIKPHAEKGVAFFRVTRHLNDEYIKIVGYKREWIEFPGDGPNAIAEPAMRLHGGGHAAMFEIDPVDIVIMRPMFELVP